VIIGRRARFELFGRKNGSAAVSPNWTMVQNSARCALGVCITNATVNLAPGQARHGATGSRPDTYIRQILDWSIPCAQRGGELSDIETLTFRSLRPPLREQLLAGAYAW
jgi:hypothetical protein